MEESQIIRIYRLDKFRIFDRRIIDFLIDISYELRLVKFYFLFEFQTQKRMSLYGDNRFFNNCCDRR